MDIKKSSRNLEVHKHSMTLIILEEYLKMYYPKCFLSHSLFYLQKVLFNLITDGDTLHMQHLSQLALEEYVNNFV